MNKSMRSLVFATLLLAMIAIRALSVPVPLVAKPTEHHQQFGMDEDKDFPSSLDVRRTSLRGVSRFLGQRTRVPFAGCDKAPKICVKGGIPRRHCCNKKCVDITTDKLNCGRCGHKCNFSKICCRGKCVNPLRNVRHCGGCKNRCRRGSKCVYGMCSYA